jgi:RNA recognition motif-containing protein
MSLFVGNISRNVSFKDLEREFSRYGECRVDLRVTSLANSPDSFRAAMDLLNIHEISMLKMLRPSSIIKIMAVYKFTSNGVRNLEDMTPVKP